jgi:hypothetical protein
MKITSAVSACVRNKVSVGPFSKDLTLATYLCISLQVLGEEQLIWKLKLGEIHR